MEIFKTVGPVSLAFRKTVLIFEISRQRERRVKKGIQGKPVSKGQAERENKSNFLSKYGQTA